MKKIRHLCLAALLTFTLTQSAFAGLIECGVTPPPAPAESRAGEIECGKLGVEAIYAALTGVWIVL
jgi:hypothetical protein